MKVKHAVYEVQYYLFMVKINFIIMQINKTEWLTREALTHSEFEPVCAMVLGQTAWHQEEKREEGRGGEEGGDQGESL